MPDGDGALRRLSIEDEELVAQVFERFRPKLLSFARSHGLPASAEDVVQETFLAAIAAIRGHGLQRVDSIQAWLYGILRHKLADSRKATDHPLGQSVALQALDSAGDGQAVALPNHLRGSLDLETVLAVREALERLPPRHWLVLMLNQRQGLKTHEIAKIIGLSAGRVGAILSEAKAMFRRQIRGEESV